MSIRARHRRNRACTVFLTAVVLAWTIGALFLFQSFRGVGSSATTQTNFGFLGWVSYTDRRPVSLGEVLTPGNGITRQLHPGRLMATLLIAVAVTAFAAYFLRRTFDYFGWDLCRSEGCPVCDYSLAGRRYGGCPECGWKRDKH